MGDLAGGIGVGVAGNAAWALVLFLLQRAQALLGRRNPTVRVAFLGLASAAFALANILYRRYFPADAYWFVIASFGIFATSWWVEVRRYWHLGIIGVGATGEGRYAEALGMCRNSLDFLGIGARKLTDKGAAFEEAINRCHRQNRPVRLLLCAPDNAELISFAKQAARPAEEYQERVRASLRVIRDLKVERARNIEVRFYEQLPVFRLMFINEELCLTSHYVFGEGDGSQLPDVYIRRRAGKRDVQSIYYGFQQYFEQVWKRAEPWNFESHLG